MTTAVPAAGRRARTFALPVALPIALSVALSLLLAPAAATPQLPAPAAAAAQVTTEPVAAAARTVDDAAPGLTITDVSPVVAAPGEPLTITGVLDAVALDLAGGSALTAPTATADPDPPADRAEDTGTAAIAPEPVAIVQVRLGAERIETAQDIDGWLAQTGASQGRVLASTDIAATSADSRPDDSQPDDSRPEEMAVPFSATIGDLTQWMRGAYGVLPVSIEVWAGGATEPAAAVRTFVGYQVRKEYVPLQLTWVVPFTAPHDPTLLGEFSAERTQAWRELLGEDGTLRQRLVGADEPGVVWALDPSLLTGGPFLDEGETSPSADQTPAPTATESATSAAPGTTATAGPPTPEPSPEDGPQPTPDNGQPTPESVPEDETPAQTERRLRRDFAAELLDAARGRDILLLPTYDADVAGLPAEEAQGAGPAAVRSLLGRSLDVEQARSALTAAGASVTLTAWPADGSWSITHDASLHDLATVSGSSPWSVLASTASVAGSVRGPFAAPSGDTVLPYDTEVGERVNAAHDAAGAVPAALALVADALVILNQRPGTPGSLTVALDRSGAAADVSSDLTDLLDDVPWLELAPTLTATQRGSLLTVAPPVRQPALLVDDRAVALAGTTSRLPIAASVREDSAADLATRGADTLARLTSVHWRGHPQDWSAAYDPIAADVSATFTGLTIPPRDIAFLADSGLLRVTVENALDSGIENATLHLSVEEPILRIESDPQPVQVGAQSRTTVGFQATSIASGRVSVTATLRAPDGTVLGEPTPFSVRVSPTSDWIYWVLGAAAAVVIAIGVVRMALRRRSGGVPASDRTPA